MLDLLKRITGSSSLRKVSGATIMPPGAIAVQPGTLLLASRVGQVNSIASVAGVPEAHFNALYLPALENIAGLAQELPSPNNSNLSILDETLQRTLNAVSLRRGYLLPKGADTETISKKADLWTYAVFVSAILPAIADILNRPAWLYDAAALDIGRWEPWQGSMVDTASWYITEDATLTKDDQTRAMPACSAPLLAPLLIPPEGLAWLWTDREVMACLLSAISGTDKDKNVLNEIVYPDAKEQSDTATPKVRLAKETPSLPEPRSAQKRRTTRSKFIAWLRIGIADGTLSINTEDSHIHIVPEGVLLVIPNIFRTFAGVKASQAQKAFLKSTLCRRNPENNTHYFLYTSTEGESLKGLIVDHTLVYPEGGVPQHNPELTKMTNQR